MAKKKTPLYNTAKPASAKTYASAYSDDLAGSKARSADRLKALQDRQLGGSFASLGKKNGRDAYRDRRTGKTFYVNSRGGIITGSGEKDTSKFAQGLEERIVGAVDKNFANQFEEEQRALGNRAYDPDEGKSLQEQLTSRGIAEGKSVNEAQEAADQVNREDRAYQKAIHNTRGVQGTGELDEDAIQKQLGGAPTRQDELSKLQNEIAEDNSPVQKNSPLYNISGFVGQNPYAAGSYVGLSQKIGETFAGLEQEKQARIDRRMAEEQNLRARQQQQQMQLVRQQQIQEGIKNQQTYLNSADDVRTKNASVNSKLTKLSRGIADDAYALTKQLSNNEIDVDEYAHRYGQITENIPKLKQAAETMNAYSTAFAALDPKMISDANDPEKFEIANRIATGDPSIDFTVIDGVPHLQSFETDDNGQIVIGEDGKPVPDGTVNMSVDELQNLYKPITKAPDPNENLQALVKELENVKGQAYQYETDPVTGQPTKIIKRGPDGLPLIKDPNWNIYDFSETAKNRVAAQFDTIINEQGLDGLKSLAKDYFPETQIGGNIIQPDGSMRPKTLGDLDSDELESFMQEQPTGEDAGDYTSRLEQVLEGAYINKAQGMFNHREELDVKNYQAQQRIDLNRAQEKRISDAANTPKPVAQPQGQDWVQRLQGSQKRNQDGTHSYNENFRGQLVGKEMIFGVSEGEDGNWSIQLGKPGKNNPPIPFKSQKALDSFLYGVGQSQKKISGGGQVAPNSFGGGQITDQEVQNAANEDLRLMTNDAIAAARARNNPIQRRSPFMMGSPLYQTDPRLKRIMKDFGVDAATAANIVRRHGTSDIKTLLNTYAKQGKKEFIGIPNQRVNPNDPTTWDMGYRNT